MPITYVQPQFNIPMNMWYPPNTPATTAPNYVGQLFQVYRYSRMTNWVYLASESCWVPSIILRYAMAPAAPPDVGWIFRENGTPPYYYLGIAKAVMHRGFPNEYRVMMCVQCDDTGAPIVPPV